MSKKYEVTEEKARISQIITNGTLDYFVLAIKGNTALLQCISKKPDSFQNGEIVIASGLKQYHITGDGEDKIEWQWDSGTYFIHSVIDHLFAELLDLQPSREQILLRNAVELLEENDCYDSHDNLLDNLGMTDEEYNKLMEEI